MGSVNPVDALLGVATGGISTTVQAASSGRPLTALTMSPASQALTRTAGQQVSDVTGISKMVNKANPFAAPSIPGQPPAPEDPMAADRARIEEADKEQRQRRSKAIISTVLNTPLGVSAGAPVNRSVLSSLGG